MRVLAAAIAATCIYAVVARVAERRSGAALGSRAFRIASILTGPVACLVLSLRHSAITAAALALCAAVICVRTDLTCGLIFDSVTFTAIVLLLLRAGTSATLEEAALGCAALAAAMVALWAVTAGRGIGLGDVKFAAVIGAAFGWAWGFAALGAAFVAGAAVATVLLATRRASQKTAMPFAPFLAVGCAFAAAMGGSLS